MADYTRKELVELLMAMEKSIPSVRITSPSDIITMFVEELYVNQELFMVVGLDGAHNIIYKEIVTKGILNKTLVHPREIFRKAIVEGCESIIAVHNHPSGSAEPSTEDDQITERLKKAGKVIGINLLDHIIIGKKGYFSYTEEYKL